MATTANGTPYVESSDLVANYPAISLALANKVDSFAKIRQVIRATDTTNRSTTSATFVDANLSVTITPQRTTSAVLLVVSISAVSTSTTDPSPFSVFAITDSSNNVISGAQSAALGGFNIARENTGTGREFINMPFITAWATPGVTTAVTYKLRFRSNTTNVTTNTFNANNTGQIYAIEVAA